jgi:hypothetical protein
MDPPQIHQLQQAKGLGKGNIPEAAALGLGNASVAPTVHGSLIRSLTIVRIR